MFKTARFERIILKKIKRRRGSRAVGSNAYDLSRQRILDGYVVHDDYAVLPVYLSSELGAKASEVDMWSGAVLR